MPIGITLAIFGLGLWMFTAPGTVVRGARMTGPPSRSSASRRPSVCRTQQRTTFKEHFLHPFHRVTYETQRALDDVSFSVEPRRVLRHHRPERKRQEHAAEDPRRHLPRRQRLRPRRRPALAVHRARRRLQLRAERARQRARQRHAARALAPRARRALRRDHRLRRARAVRRPEAQELLVGHAPPSRLLDRDPGRVRHPPARRGARGRRPELPGEVLRGRSSASARRGRRSSS